MNILCSCLIFVDFPGIPAIIPSRGTLISYIPGKLLDVKITQLTHFSCSYLLSESKEILPENICIYIARPLQIIFDQIYFFTKNIKYSNKIRNSDLYFPPKFFSLILSNKTKNQLCAYGLLLMIGAVCHPFFSILAILGYYSLQHEYSYEFSGLMYVILFLSVFSLFLKYNYPMYSVGVKFPGTGRRLQS